MTYKDQGLKVVALDSRETLDKMPSVQQYVKDLQLTMPVGMEDPSTTYDAIVANYPGPNPFPLDIVVGKDGIIKYVTKEYDPDAMTQAVEAALAE